MAFGGSLVRNARLADSKHELLEEVSYETLVLQTRSVTFGGSPCTKRSFWRLGASLLETSFTKTLLVYGQTLWRNYVRDVVVP